MNCFRIAGAALIAAGLSNGCKPDQARPRPPDQAVAPQDTAAAAAQVSVVAKDFQFSREQVPGRFCSLGRGGLEAGNYGLICFFPDTRDGKPHLVHGMMTNVKVG
jgi:hypothetical protein